jgi:hypothetical protein
MVVHVMWLVRVALTVESFVQAAAHAAIVVMLCAAVQHAVVLSVAAMAEHVVRRVCRRMGAGRPVGRRGVVAVVEDGAARGDGRAVPGMQVPRMLGVIEEELAAGIEPVEPIGHHRTRVSLWARRWMGGEWLPLRVGVEECGREGVRLVRLVCTSTTFAARFIGPANSQQPASAQALCVCLPSSYRAGGARLRCRRVQMLGVW